LTRIIAEEGGDYGKNAGKLLISGEMAHQGVFCARKAHFFEKIGEFMAEDGTCWKETV